jgi:hypothetical protein
MAAPRQRALGGALLPHPPRSLPQGRPPRVRNKLSHRYTGRKPAAGGRDTLHSCRAACFAAAPGLSPGVQRRYGVGLRKEAETTRRDAASAGEQICAGSTNPR